ncbi:MAG: hypothetical protein AB1Z81_03550 [Desulfotignum sp.]
MAQITCKASYFELFIEVTKKIATAENTDKINLVAAIGEQGGIAVQRTIDYNRLKQTCKDS